MKQSKATKAVEWFLSGMTLAGLALMAEGLLLEGFIVGGLACALWAIFFYRFALFGLVVLELAMLAVNFRGIWNL